MAYADQQMSGNKVTALIVVAILHVVVGYALVTGLAYSAFKKIKEVTTAVNIKDEPPPPPPPPPPKDAPPPPPIVAPPPPITFTRQAPVLQTVSAPPPVAPPPAVVLPPPPSAPPPPPAPRFSPKGASPKGNPGNWATSNDYPSRALREERAGTTGFHVTVGTDGKVADCSITRSSGSPDLDQATCDNIRRRARFTPATDGEGNPTTGSYSSSVRWVIPKD
ncbi:energy transducer TonB [Novosphingobium lentum]|uniref:energy transducer TonB n=1 Tax=Novosphingobium lentum TaxID=145287 RepID=UPI00082BD31C|nr:energy transducer TonB [Novosphingobium lentum]